MDAEKELDDVGVFGLCDRAFGVRTHLPCRAKGLLCSRLVMPFQDDRVFLRPVASERALLEAGKERRRRSGDIDEPELACEIDLGAGDPIFGWQLNQQIRLPAARRQTPGHGLGDLQQRPVEIFKFVFGGDGRQLIAAPEV